MSTATMSPPKRKTQTRVSAINKPVVVVPEPEFVIHTPKKAALIQLNNLKDDVSWPEIFDYLELRKELQQSMWECNNGLVYTQEEMEAEFA